MSDPLHPRYLGAVAGGGALGAVSRYLLTLGLGPLIGAPVATLIINVVGCGLLGVLLTVLARIGAGGRSLPTVRLLLGTGLLGGFTTYSALATDTGLLLDSGRFLAALGYGLGSVLLGLLAAWAGMLLPGRSRGGRTR